MDDGREWPLPTTGMEPEPDDDGREWPLGPEGEVDEPAYLDTGGGEGDCVHDVPVTECNACSPYQE